LKWECGPKEKRSQRQGEDEKGSPHEDVENRSQSSYIRQGGMLKGAKLYARRRLKGGKGKRKKARG